MKIDSRLIQNVVKNWNKDSTSDLIEAIRVELRRDVRKAHKDDIPIYERLIEEMPTQEFWIMLDILSEFTFDA